MVNCQDRGGSFRADPAIPGTDLNRDYPVGCGYDKGHNMPQNDNACSATGTKECFYYSNCFPQTPKLNRGVWKALENKERQYANQYGNIEVFIGSYGQLGTMGPDRMTVPAFCWKVIYVQGHFEAYIFPNSTTVSGHPEDFELSGNKDKIERITGYDFDTMVLTH